MANFPIMFGAAALFTGNALPVTDRLELKLAALLVGVVFVKV